MKACPCSPDPPRSASPGCPWTSPCPSPPETPRSGPSPSGPAPCSTSLYLALEDTPRRLKARIGKLLGDRTVPAGLDIATEWPTLPAGGDLALASWLDTHPAARLVVIDVFAKVRGPVPAGVSAYDADYAAVGRAKHIADAHGIAVILVHHVRKASSEDFLQEVSGTNGIAGAADATLVLKRGRGQAEGVLHVTGRDVEETEYALTVNPDTRRWLQLDGPATDHQLSDTRTTILRFLRENPGSTPREITDGTGLGYDTVRRTCARMTADGQARVDGQSRYTAPDSPGVSQVSHLSQPEGIPGMTSVNGWDTGRTSAVPPVPPTNASVDREDR